MPIYETNGKFFFCISSTFWKADGIVTGFTSNMLTEYIRSHTWEEKWRETIQNK